MQDKKNEIEVLRREGMSYDKIAKTLHISKREAYQYGRDIKVLREGEGDAVKALTAELKKCNRARKRLAEKSEDLLSKLKDLKNVNKKNLKLQEKVDKLEYVMRDHKILEDKLRALERKNYSLKKEVNKIETIKSQRDRFESEADFYCGETKRYKELLKLKTQEYVQLEKQWRSECVEPLNDRIAGMKAKIKEATDEIEDSRWKLESEHKPVLRLKSLRNRVKHLEELNSIVKKKLFNAMIVLKGLY